jgi:DinB family protein
MGLDRAPRNPADVLEACRRQLAQLPALLDGLLAELDDAAARRRPSPREWAPVEIVCHLRDEETEDFGARVRAVVAAETRFVRIDPEAWATERRYLDEPLPPVLSDLRARRTATLGYLGGLDAECLRQAVPLRDGGSLSGLDLVVAWVAHDRLHLIQLAATLARIWADRWSPLQAAYAGPIPYEPAPPTG